MYSMTPEGGTQIQSIRTKLEKSTDFQLQPAHFSRCFCFAVFAECASIIQHHQDHKRVRCFNELLICWHRSYTKTPKGRVYVNDDIWREVEYRHTWAKHNRFELCLNLCLQNIMVLSVQICCSEFSALPGFTVPLHIRTLRMQYPPDGFARRGALTHRRSKHYY